MRIVCSWCRNEGQIGLVGEKAPLEDRRETHGICVTHRIAVQTRWRERIRVSQEAGRKFVPAGSASDGSSTDPGPQFSLSAAGLWVGFKNLSRKVRS